MTRTAAMVLDPDETTVEVLKKIARDQDFDLTSFQDHESAEGHILKKGTGIVFIDLMMIIADDYQMLHRIRIRRPNVIVCILVSVKSNKRLDLSRFEDHHTFLLEKPLDYNAAAEKIRQMINGKCCR